MLRKLTYTLGALALFGAMPAIAAAPVIGQAAPDFEAIDVHGNAFKLSEHKGEAIVIEWTNHQCPFVVKHYETGNMQAVQKAAMEKGAKWVQILSSAPGKQGHLSAEEAIQITKDDGATITTKILDESGTIGNLYEAKTTPHMFVVNTEGVLAYAGAIDDKPSPSHKTVKGAQNYVLAALDNLAAGEAVTTPQTPPYGCGVKYAH